MTYPIDEEDKGAQCVSRAPSPWGEKLGKVMTDRLRYSVQIDGLPGSLPLHPPAFLAELSWGNTGKFFEDPNERINVLIAYLNGDLLDF